MLSNALISIINHTKTPVSSKIKAIAEWHLPMATIYFRVYLLSCVCCWMATEKAEVSNQANFGSKPMHLQCPAKSKQRADPSILLSTLTSLASGLLFTLSDWLMSSAAYRYHRYHGYRYLSTDTCIDTLISFQSIHIDQIFAGFYRKHFTEKYC